MTAHYLSQEFVLKPESTCLVHAGAGGVGTMLIQLAKLKGATVLATVGSRDKAETAKSCGADHVILYQEMSFRDEVRRVTKDQGVDIVYDTVGKDTFVDSLALVDPAWVAAHRDDPNVCLIEVAGLDQEDLQAYKAGHVPGAHPWKWKEMLWDTHMREFPVPQEFARRLGAAGIGNDTTVVFYGEGVQFGIYAWWVFRYCGHENVRVLDGARYRWAEEGRPLVIEEPASHPVKTYAPVARVERMRAARGDVARAGAESHFDLGCALA
jgi:hypothetical protein